LLTEGWSAKTHNFGAGSTIKGPRTIEIDLHTDHDRDLDSGCTRYEGDGLIGPCERELHPGIDHCDTGVHLPRAEPTDGLDVPADRVARASAARRAADPPPGAGPPEIARSYPGRMQASPVEVSQSTHQKIAQRRH
jgi:hypothetical protein